ncbi:MAG TPA: glycogen debranching enzyme N-terminal domain-containing protein, partial [Vicinamibacteria bacterium]|nr:glycogen debranching enzyme N-terminal domain-containing protein [Vicinamibacteria bacterium]
MPGARETAEWLEADGLGGFASGTISGLRTRRYHALLLAAATPPTGRALLVNGFDAWVETEQGRFAITSQRYAPDTVDPDGASRVESFVDEPWPHWSFRLEDGTLVEHEVFVPKGSPLVALCWRIHGPRVPATLTVRPFLAGRDYHALHHENADFRFEAELQGERVTWRPYRSVAAVTALANGGYFHEPHWY